MSDPQTTSGLDDTSLGDASDDRTREAVEAEYRARIAGKDRAHAAEVQRLNDELNKARQEAAKAGGIESLQQEQQRLQRELEEERAGRLADARKARFPGAAELLGDTVATLDEERLTALENRLANSGGSQPQSAPSTPLSNMAARPTGQERAPDQKTREELLADLERLSPEFLASLGS